MVAKDERKRIVLWHWYPSHEGVEWNELVNDDVKRAADILLERDECSLAHAQHLLAVQLKVDWRDD